MSQRLRFGILGTGNIANQLCRGVATSRRCELVAVGSRRQASAEAFAAQYGIPRAYDAYERVLDDPDVDAVYISLPNSLHCPWTIRALQAGKHVLCEKPFALNVAEAQKMFEAARQAGRRVMEAFMYRSHPLTRAVHETIQRGEIGALRIIRTSFCYRTRKIEGNVRFDPALGGGILLDVGCYCIDFARMFAGEEPQTILAIGHRHPTGVDDLVVGSMQFPSGILASMSCGMSAQADNTAYLLGEEGYISIPVPWKPPASGAKFTVSHGIPPKMDAPGAEVARPGLVPHRTFEIDAPGDLYGLEADDFAAAILEDKPFTVPEADTLGNARVLEAMQRQIHEQWKAGL